MFMLRRIAPTVQQPLRTMLFHHSARAAYAYPLDRNGKPLNAFMKFTKEKRAEVLSAHPELKTTEIASKIGALWKALSDTERNSYLEEAKRELEKYKSSA